MGLSVSKGWQGVSFESVVVWSFLFWNESVLAQNYTKKFCQETLSFVSMSLQIFPNKFDVSQQDPAFIQLNKSTSLNNINPQLTRSTGSCQKGVHSWPHSASSRKAQAFCHGPDKVVYSCFSRSPYNTVTTSYFDKTWIQTFKVTWIPLMTGIICVQFVCIVA